MIPTLRNLGYTVDKATKSELREIDKKNARKFNCVEEWKREDKDYFAEVNQPEEKTNEESEAEDHDHDEDGRVVVVAEASARYSRYQRHKKDMKEKKSD